MAKLVRKVNKSSAKASRNATGGGNWFQKLIRNKIFIGTLIGLLVAFGGCCLGHYIYVKYYASDSESIVEYFKDDYLIDNGYITKEDNVKFTYVNYRGLQYYVDSLDRKFSDTYLEDVFVFCYDSESFTISDDIADSKNTNKQLLSRLIDFQKTIDAMKADGKAVEFYIMDLAIGSNSNIKSDSVFVGDSEEASDASMIFAYITDGKVKTTFDYNTVDKDNNPTTTKKSIFGTTASSISTTVLPNVTNFVKQEF